MMIIKITIFVLSIFCLVNCRSLTQLVCQLNPRRCQDFKDQAPPILGHTHSGRGLGAPSLEEFRRWNNYEEEAQGTGFLKPETGIANGIPYGPGLGDIGITTGVGVQHPFGGLGIERDFGISMGGNGRIGGIPVGWGNGGIRSVGSAPWANP